MNIPQSITAPLPRLYNLLPGRAQGLLRLSRSVRLTREGRWYILVVLVTGGVAINTGNNLLYLVLATLLSLIIISGLMSEFTMKKLVLKREQPKAVFKDTPFAATLLIKNSKKIIPTISVRFYELPCRAMLSKYSYVVKIGAGEVHSATAARTATSRGLIKLKGFKISTTFPFGLFLKSKIIKHPGEIIVYPAVKAISNVRLNNGILLPRGESRCKRGSGSELYNIRPYTEHDDARHIHWKSAARADTLMVKEFEEEANKSLIVNFQNLSEADAEELFEEKVDETAGTINFLLERGYSVGLETLSGNVADGAGNTHFYRILEYLALIEPAGTGTPTIKVREA